MTARDRLDEMQQFMNIARGDLSKQVNEGHIGQIEVGGNHYPWRRIPIEVYDEFKAQYPGSRVKFRGPKRGKPNTSKPDATHFYVVRTGPERPKIVDPNDETQYEPLRAPHRPEDAPHTPGYNKQGSAGRAAADSRAQAFIFDDVSEELPPIHAIARDIIRNWKKVNFGAVPYLDAMQSLSTRHDDYGADSGSSILAYGLSNMSHYSGRSVHDPELAKKHRAQLKRHLKEKINLDSIVKSVLEEFPGQPKDYVDPEDSTDEPTKTYDDEYSSEIEDEELGLRFD